MNCDNSIAIIIPAYNEEKKLAATVQTVFEAVQKKFKAWEILIFNDGSTDSTAEIADRLAEEYEFVKVIHHVYPTCLGSIYKEGLRLARMKYYMRVNGKNDLSVDELSKIFSLCGAADLVIPYTTNSYERPLIRRFLSKLFINILNYLFNLRLQYYNHSVLCKRELLKDIDILTDSYAFQAEILIKLIKSGSSYLEIGVKDTFRKGTKTKAFSFKNMWGVFVFLVKAALEKY